MIVVGSLLTFGVCAFAFHRGGEPERVMAIGAMGVLLTSLAAQMVFGRRTAWPVVGADVALSVTVGVLTAIHLRAWLYIESALSTALLLAHGVILNSGGAAVTPVYAALVNSLTLAMLGTLLLATLGCRASARAGTYRAEPAVGDGRTPRQGVRLG